MANRLSHQRVGILDNGKPISQKTLQTQVISAAVCANDLYYASLDDLATVGCFLALQMMSLLPKRCKNHLYIFYQRYNQPNMHLNMQRDEDNAF